jgi:hypothetical protein
MNSIIKNISNSTGIDIRVVAQVVHHPFKFVRDKISSNDERPIRIRYFGIFAQKPVFNKKSQLKRKVEILSRDNLKDVANQLQMTEEGAFVHLNKLLEEKKYVEVNKIYKILYPRVK